MVEVVFRFEWYMWKLLVGMDLRLLYEHLLIVSL